MDNKTLIDKYRERLVMVHCATVAIVSCVEIFAYFVFVYFGIQTLSLECRYLWVNVVTPICINVIAHLVARRICHSPNIAVKIKNSSIVYAAFVTTFVVSMFHRDYTVTMCAFVFPIILSAMYNDKKLLKKSVVLALISLSVTVAILIAEQKIDLTTALNIVVLYGFIAVSYLSGDLSIRFSQSNFSLIEEQADANSRLEVILDLDQMTQLFNHKTFYEKLDMAVAEAKKGGQSCSLAMIDIDDFKKVNDTYGHNSGDIVLIVLADILKECCRENIYACRYGGEEFGVIFCGKTVSEAEKIISDVLKRFSEHRFDFTKENYTFSCGITSFAHGDTKETIFDRADNYLYASKKNGKNRITTDGVKCL